jgi:hypothetical protein
MRFMILVKATKDSEAGVMPSERLASCLRSSGVNSAPKSSASKSGRISTSPSSLYGLGQRLTHSIASSLGLALP